MWRAIRYGLDGELIDLQREETYPAREAAERLLRGRRRSAPSWESRRRSLRPTARSASVRC